MEIKEGLNADFALLFLLGAIFSVEFGYALEHL